MGNVLESLTDVSFQWSLQVSKEIIQSAYIELKCDCASHLVTVLVLTPDIGGRLEVGAPGVANVEPSFLVGILEGVPSSLTSESVEPCRDAGFEVLGVRLDRTGIEVLVDNVLEGVRDGVRRP